MDEYGALQRALREKVEALWREVSWDTPRDRADSLRWQAIQACHALHRAANPAYQARCTREGIGEYVEPPHLPALVFPEEIYKGYAEEVRADGRKLGPFCERDVPLLLKHLNRYLVHPMRLDGMARSYIRLTNLRGGLDRLRADLQRGQGVTLVTSSGTTGGPFSLIPLDGESLETLLRANARALAETSRVPPYGPIDPEKDFMVGYLPRGGSMVMAMAFQHQAQRFGKRACMAIPAHVQTKELRWRAGLFNGLDGKMLRVLVRPFLHLAGRRTARSSLQNMLAGLQQAQESGRRTAVVGNAWMMYRTLREMEALLAREVARGRKRPGEPLFRLAPGSVLIFGGGNKSSLHVPEEEIIALARRVIGGLDRATDIYSQAEGFGFAVRCPAGNYHLDPHVHYFTVDSYLAYYDPRQTNRVPGILTGDLVDSLHEEPCPCGAPTRFFSRIHRDDRKRGSKGCAAALADYG